LKNISNDSDFCDECGTRLLHTVLLLFGDGISSEFIDSGDFM